MKVVVASENPVKVGAVREGFQKMFPDETLEIVTECVDSGVSEQPKNDEETYKGAMTRALNALEAQKDADYFVGIEGGVEDKNGELECFAWVVICSRNGKCGKGKSSTFFLPKKVADLVRGGMELGDASDEVFQEDNVKQKQGSIGCLTDNNIDRKKYYIEPVIIALIPFKNPHLYQ